MRKILTICSYFYKMKIKSIILVIAMSTSVLAMQAQQAFNTKEDKSVATYHIKALNKGVLLVRLPSNRKKIAALENTLDQDLSENDHKKLSKRLNKTIQETDERLAAIIGAMDSTYHFSEYAFFLDYDTREVLESGKKLYQSDMKAAYDLSDTSSIYILTLGKTPENSIDAFIVLNDELQGIPLPFPSTVTMRASFIDIIIFWESWERRRVNHRNIRYIQRLDSGLQSYFNGLIE